MGLVLEDIGLEVLGFGCLGLGVLGGSWVVTSGVISRVTIVITHIRGLITPFMTVRASGLVYSEGFTKFTVQEPTL